MIKGNQKHHIRKNITTTTVLVLTTKLQVRFEYLD